jgi:glycosyltransferase involved in cell wall biosynthesis
MDVLFASPRFPPDARQTTMTQLACRLVDRGYDVRGVHEAGRDSTEYFPVDDFAGPAMRSPWWVSLWRYYRAWRAEMDAYLTAHDPDVVVTNQRSHVPTVQGARGQDVPVVAVIEGLGFMRYDPTNLALDKTPRFLDLPTESKVQYPFVRSLFRQQRAAFPDFAAVVALSAFLGDVVDASFGVDARVIRTMVDIDAVRADDHDPECIIMVNPRSKLKGGDIFLDIAGRMADEQFLVAGDFATNDQRGRAAALDNVTYLGWVDDMREVYGRAKLLLVPSIVEEGGPRVIVEAFANGVPVVGTNRGGVPGFIGDAGAVVDDPYDIDEWVRTVEATLEVYDRFRPRAFGRAPLFDADDAVERYVSLLSEVAGWEGDGPPSTQA